MPNGLQQGPQKADKVGKTFFEWFAMSHHELPAGFVMRFRSGAGLPATFLKYCLGLNLPAGGQFS